MEFSVRNAIFATFSETTENNPLPATALENCGLKWWQGCEMELSGLRGEAAAAGGSGQSFWGEGRQNIIKDCQFIFYQEMSGASLRV